LEHFATHVEQNGAVAEDSRLIRSEVERCRLILQGMRAQGAEFSGELPVRLLAEDVVKRLWDQLPAAVSQRLQVKTFEPVEMVVPLQALLQSLCALLKNAAEASEQTPIALEIIRCENLVKFSVKDEGSGMPDDVLKRVGEPFFTTKPAGKGMGLGTFLVRTFAEYAGGSLQFDSLPGRGTTALLAISAHALSKKESLSGGR
jgi:two-component system sensor histidine kinase RegB